MIELDDKICKKIVDRLLSIMSDKYNENFTITYCCDEFCILTKSKAICYVKTTMFFTDEKHLLSMMMKYPFNFYNDSFDLKKEFGSTIEEIMIACDLNY